MKEFKKLKNAVHSICLSEEEKSDGRNEFLEFMEKNPVHRQNYDRGFTRFLDRFYAMTRRPMAATATLLGVFVVSASGLSYAAESTVPGDLLYPVKIHVNEQVQGFFYFDAKSKAQWELDRIERRLEEVETLKNAGKLDIKIKTEVKQELDVNAKAVVEHLKELKAEGKEEEVAEIESTFDSVFNLHEEAALDIEFNITEIDPIVIPDSTDEEEEELEEEAEEDPIIEENLPTDTLPSDLKLPLE
ncbi:MAG: DUF5667 domain-containing protein [Patescibacteria group bacterium]